MSTDKMTKVPGWGNVKDIHRNKNGSGKPKRQRVVVFELIEGEEWRDAAGFEGIYQVSSMGRIKSVKRLTDHNNRVTGYQEVGGTLFSLQTNDLGYHIVQLKKDGVSKTQKVHRIVAKTFIPNPHNKKEVNHLNAIRNDNRVENLEWATRQENNAYSMKLQKERWIVYKNAYDLTVGAGINPEAVPDLLKALTDLAYAAAFKGFTGGVLSSGVIEAAQAAIEKAKL